MFSPAQSQSWQNASTQAFDGINAFPVRESFDLKNCLQASEWQRERFAMSLSLATESREDSATRINIFRSHRTSTAIINEPS
jgi:hypothetical protein